MSITKKTITQVASINRNTDAADKALLDVCSRAVRLAYNGLNDEANYILTTVKTVYRGRVVSFYKRFGVVVIENKGELPKVSRVEDKSAQKKVFERMAECTTFGLTAVKTAEDVAAAQVKKDAAQAKLFEKTTAEQRAKDMVQKLIKAAQRSGDLDVVPVLSAFIN